ncbi:MAG: fibronectin type III domain-containing protein [Gammaproteobacteria bacterium]|nr:fibronectin type III domain-containing protein [Gammaproteobacteria bacterium]
MACNLDRRPCQPRRAGIRVSFNEGTVLAGSGGSGLFWADRLIGVASSTDLCTEAWYGNFSEFFPRVRRWLAGPERQNRQDGHGRGQVLVHVDGQGETTGELQVPVREGDGSTYALSIEPRPTAEVTVELQTSGDADLKASPDMLHFTAENWDRPQEVTLSAREDDDREDGSATVAHLLTSSDHAYQHAGRPLRVSERDNDLEVSATAPLPTEPGELEVTWEPVAGAVSYIVEWRTSSEEFEDCHEPDDASCPADRTRVVAAVDTNTTLKDLEGDTLYFVRVTAKLDPSYGYLPASVFSVVTLVPQRPFLRGWRLVVPWERR